MPSRDTPTRPAQPERDPCAGCAHLITRPPLAPWCDRGVYYGQVGCLRHPNNRGRRRG